MVVLNPAESRRLLAKATVALPEVQNAWKNGMIIIGRGITNAYVSEEPFNISVEPKAAQTLGLVTGGITNVNMAPPPCTWPVPLIDPGALCPDGGTGQTCHAQRLNRPMGASAPTVLRPNTRRRWPKV